MKNLLGGFFILFAVVCSSCIFGPSTKRVMSYRHDTVYLTHKDRFQIGSLPEGWKRLRVRAHAIAFHNAALEATISTDAFCGPSYEDISLSLLTSHLLAGAADRKVQKEREFMLDGRGALRTTAVGEVDGVPLKFDIVVVKKNKCIIDFVSVAPGKSDPAVAEDFEGFYSGFHYE